jgi:hypothetical protein
MIVSLCQQLGPPGLADPVVVKGAMPAAIAAAIAAVEVIFLRQDHQALLVIIKIYIFN